MDVISIPFPPSKEPNMLSPLVLAYIGDAVYELYIRQYVISQANHRPQAMHREATRFVSAKAQANALKKLLPILTEEELNIVKKGRNAKSNHVPKNADVLEYRHSTAFECLIGYLYYSQQSTRLQELLNITLGRIQRGSGGSDT